MRRAGVRDPVLPAEARLPAEAVRACRCGVPALRGGGDGKGGQRRRQWREAAIIISGQCRPGPLTSDRLPANRRQSGSLPTRLATARLRAAVAQPCHPQATVLAGHPTKSFGATPTAADSTVSPAASLGASGLRVGHVCGARGATGVRLPRRQPRLAAAAHASTMASPLLLLLLLRRRCLSGLIPVAPAHPPPPSPLSSSSSMPHGRLPVADAVTSLPMAAGHCRSRSDRVRIRCCR